MIKENITFTLITIVDNKDVYNEFQRNLEMQTNIKYELIPIMNLNNELDSPREAFNESGKNARGKYIMFIHPDIRFLSRKALHDIAEEMNKIVKEYLIKNSRWTKRLVDSFPNFKIRIEKIKQKYETYKNS